MRRPEPRGFTLVELMAALALVGFVMVGGIMLLDQLGDSAQRIASEGTLAAREGNGARMLRRLFADASASSDSTKTFRGDERSLDFWSLCDVPGGWAEPCHVSLAIDERLDGSGLLASLSTGGSLLLRQQRGASVFRYYNPSSDTLWLRDWSSHATLPVAVALVGDGDTTVLAVSVAR
jgi:prepilin-type N-terminal cleavage/methylation domain-containing protein